jgi:quercetin dioxygenase-like cupin family protein
VVVTPYVDTERQLGCWVRRFSIDVSPADLKWHRDRLDRSVEVLSGSDWAIQFDDCLPVELERGDTIMIPAGLWHRIVRGSTDLVLRITES